MAFSEQSASVPEPVPRPNPNVRGKIRQYTGDPKNPYGLGKHINSSQLIFLLFCYVIINVPVGRSVSSELNMHAFSCR